MGCMKLWVIEQAHWKILFSTGVLREQQHSLERLWGLAIIILAPFFYPQGRTGRGPF